MNRRQMAALAARHCTDDRLRSTLTGHSDFSTDMPKAAGRGVTMRRVARSGNVRRETCRQILRATVFMGRQLNAVYCAVGRNNIDWN